MNRKYRKYQIERDGELLVRTDTPDSARDFFGVPAETPVRLVSEDSAGRTYAVPAEAFRNAALARNKEGIQP